MSFSPWNKSLSGCEFLREEVGEPRVWDGAEIPVPTLVALCPRGVRAGMALPALLHPCRVDGNISWVCSSSTRPFQPSQCPGENSLGKDPSPRKGREAAPALEDGETRMGVKDGRWMKDSVVHMKPPASGGQFLVCSAPSPPEVMVKGSARPSGQNQAPLSSPGTPQTWIPPAAHSQGCLFYYNQAESRIPVITTTSDGKSAISHPPAAGWS